jgi:hypothetical protein
MEENKAKFLTILNEKICKRIFELGYYSDFKALVHITVPIVIDDFI